MSTNTFAKWNGMLVAAVVLVLMPVWVPSQAETDASTADETPAPVVDDKQFILVTSWSDVPEDGWLEFAHADKKLKFGVPAPAVPLQAAEWKQWRNDLMTFQFAKLRDRQLLYVYYLWPPDAEDAKAKEHAEAVLEAIGMVPAVSTAIGVEYDTSGKQLLGGDALYRWAALPVKWDQAAYEFTMAEHEPAKFADAVEALATLLQKGAFANFEAVEKWSALAQQAEFEAPYLKTISKGPLNWQELEPVASFIAVDQKLDIEGVEPAPILTSKAAWGATEK